MLDSSVIAVDPRVATLEAQLAIEMAADEERYNARRAALEVTIREEDHFNQKGHHMIGGDAGKCAFCGEQVLPHA